MLQPVPQYPRLRFINDNAHLPPTLLCAVPVCSVFCSLAAELPCLFTSKPPQKRQHHAPGCRQSSFSPFESPLIHLLKARCSWRLDARRRRSANSHLHSNMTVSRHCVAAVHFTCRGLVSYRLKTFEGRCTLLTTAGDSGGKFTMPLAMSPCT